MSSDALKWAKSFPAGSPTKKAILLILADYADEEWSCYPGKEKLAKMACTSVRTVQRVLGEWEDEGLITRHYRKAKEGRGRTSDRIYIHVPEAQDQGDTVSGWSEDGQSTKVTPVVDQGDTGGRPTCQSLSPDIPEEPQGEPQDLRPIPPPPKKSATEIERDFDEWWEAWPKGRRIDKAESLVEYTKARKEASRDELLSQNIAYGRLLRAQGTEPRFIVHPKRWLKKRRWSNDYESLLAAEEEAQRQKQEPPPLRFG